MIMVLNAVNAQIVDYNTGCQYKILKICMRVYKKVGESVYPLPCMNIISLVYIILVQYINLHNQKIVKRPSESAIYH